jgi:CubicO group peptidase (beta-lactamase class C family)
MLFRIGSVTKMFTTAALVSLAEEGKLKLDEPIGKHTTSVHGKLSRVTARRAP